ncbi:hypothetical protein [Streptomyces sp. JNUCC 63]
MDHSDLHTGVPGDVLGRHTDAPGNEYGTSELFRSRLQSGLGGLRGRRHQGSRVLGQPLRRLAHGEARFTS